MKTWSALIALGGLLQTGPAYAGGSTDPADIATIQAEIRAQGLSWTAGETRFTRMSEAERARLVSRAGPSAPWMRWLQSRPAPQAGGFAPRDFRAAGIDWRDHYGYNWDTPIRDQGNCGSCWAFSTVAALEVLIAWRESTPDPTLDLSEQQLFDCSMDSIDCESGGITWYTTGSFLAETGLTSEACYPYTSGQSGAKGACPVVEDMTVACQGAVIKTDDLTEITETLPGWPWYDPPEYTMSPEAMTLVKAYLQDRPVGASYRVYDDFYSYTGGVYEPTTTAGGGMHAVLIVGYDDPGGYWIVKNSWGDDFGEDGYFRIRYNTSSFGMFSFVYDYAQDRAEPAFCSDLPSALVIDGAGVDLFLANCGGGVLAWTVGAADDWFELRDDRGRAVSSGAEVAAGRTYRLVLTDAVAGGTTGQLRLLSDRGQEALIALEASGKPEEPRDGGSGDDGGTTGGDEPATGDGDPKPAAGCATGGNPGQQLAWILIAMGICLARRRCRLGR